MCEKNSGYKHGRFHHWLVGGLLVEGVDWNWEQVFVPRPHTGPLTMRIRFYRRTAIAEIAQQKGSVHSEYMRAHWEASREIVEKDRMLLRQAGMCKLLGVTKQTLRRWTDDGCPFRDGGACLSTVRRGEKGCEFDYWSKDEGEKVNIRRAAQPRKLENSDDVYTKEEVHRLTGLSYKHLRRQKEPQEAWAGDSHSGGDG